MSSESPVEAAERLLEAALVRERALTPEQHVLREELRRRSAVIQAGVRQPASGVFGRPGRPPKPGSS